MKPSAKIKYLRKKHHELTTRLKAVNKRKAEINAEIVRLTALRDSADHFSLEEAGKGMDIDKLKGIYIVKSRDENTLKVVFHEFFDFIRENSSVSIKEFVTNNLPKSRVGEDGKVVDLTVGALVMISAEPHPSGKQGFRFANVAPTDETGQIQLEFALAKLGKGIMPKTKEGFLVTDGQFRERIIKHGTN